MNEYVMSQVRWENVLGYLKLGLLSSRCNAALVLMWLTFRQLSNAGNSGGTGATGPTGATGETGETSTCFEAVAKAWESDLFGAISFHILHAMHQFTYTSCCIR